MDDYKIIQVAEEIENALGDIFNLIKNSLIGDILMLFVIYSMISIPVIMIVMLVCISLGKTEDELYSIRQIILPAGPAVSLIIAGIEVIVTHF